MATDIYPPELFSCTEPFNLEEYFDSFSTFLESEFDKGKHDSDKKFAVHYGIDLEELENIKHLCSPDNLTVPNEVAVDEDEDAHDLANRKLAYYTPPAAEALKIIESKKRFLNGQNNKKAYRFSSHKPVEQPLLIAPDLKPFKDIVLSVSLYYPYKHKSKFVNRLLHFTPSEVHEIDVIGSQTLAELRDKFLCTQDLALSKELETPEVVKQDMRALYPSGFLMIENCFYNDMRNEEANDYSSVLRKWAERQGKGPYQVAKMEETKIMDLKLRLGYPYLYLHQGDCEHIFVFNNVRLLGSTDSLQLSSYPKIRAEGRGANSLCFICASAVPTFLVCKSDKLPYSNNLLCKTCLESYNFLNGKKIGNFKLYPYFDRSYLNIQ